MPHLVSFLIYDGRRKITTAPSVGCGAYFLQTPDQPPRRHQAEADADGEGEADEHQEGRGQPRRQSELYTLADKEIKDRLQTVEGVSDVQLVGGGEREIQVSLNPERMKAYGVTATDVTQALQKQNQAAPDGRLTQGANEVTVRTLGKAQTVKDFESIPVVNREGYTVLLSDVAEIKDSTVEARSISLLNGQNALTIQVMKQAGGNTVTIANNVKERLTEIQKSLGDKVRMTTVSDQSTFIESSVHTVEEHLVIGSILACLVVFVFLANARMTLIAALAIPTSIVGTFAIMWALGYTLNMITMLALTLMNRHRHRRRYHRP